MRWLRWEDLYQELCNCDWFADVGKQSDIAEKHVNQIESWEVAHAWSTSKISWWCVNEASNVLSLHLSNHHRMEYRKWNDHIKSFSKPRDELVQQITARMPDVLRQDPKSVDWIRSQLTRSFIECIYAPLANIHLVCDQVEWYLRGRFPCGWTVKDEMSFPKEAFTIVY